MLKGILKHTVEGFDAYLAGGYEVGGVLFGEHSGNVVRILGFRPLPLDPPRPSFVMSESDGARLTELIQRARRDPELASYEVVGWYHSHTRCEIFLSQSDTEIYDRYFPEPWHVAMVLRPTPDQPVSIGFFFREEDGFVRTDQSYLEFAADSPVSRPMHRPEPPWVAGPAGEIEEFIPKVPERRPEPEPQPEPEPEEYAPAEEAPPVVVQTSRRAMILAWGPFAVSLVALAAGAYHYYAASQPVDPLGLQLAPSGSELVVRWNPSHPVFREASDARLLITDGVKRVDLPLLGRKTPFHSYKPVTDRVDVRLRLHLSWGRTRTDAATYLRHPDVGKPSPELAQALQNLQKAEDQAAEVRSQVSDRAAENARVQNRIDEIQHIRKQLAEARKPKRLVLPVAKEPRATPKDLPTAPEIAVRGNIPLPPQADLQLRPPVDPPKPPPLPVSAPLVRSAPVVTPKPLAPIPTPAPVKAGAGRILWTGDLPKGASLQIDGRQASRGFVNSELPSLAQVGAYPAELTNDGLKVYTGNPRYAQAPRMEPASAANGWQKTQYVYDPKAARDLIVEQMPSAREPGKLVLRAGKRLSVIVIDWQVAAQ
ncbi:MAG: hypothetical protein JNL62_21970 [Bryobacterales bacterium]|nr:hypothetical protein [Bryobacterales bacterium]